MNNGNVDSAKRKRPIIIDLSDDEDAPPATSSERESTKRPRTSERAATPPLEPVIEVPTRAAAASSLPTPGPTPQKSLYDTPEIAERYAPKFSITDEVELRNPAIFSFKPAFWKKWKPGNYVRFAEHLRQHFDPVPFARESGRPVEEIKHVFAALVVNPLYASAEARKRGEDGMNEIFDLYEKWGTPSRPWGKKQRGENGEVLPLKKGELSAVGVGVVQVILTSGNKKGLKVDELSEADKKYLEDTLTDEEMKMLWKDEDESKE